MGYRKYYQEETGKKVPRSFQVHHIDHDRANSDIINLVAIPEKLHVEYHRAFPRFLPQENQLYVPEFSDKEILSLEEAGQRLIEFAKVRDKLRTWVNFRNFLLGWEEKQYKGVGY